MRLPRVRPVEAIPLRRENEVFIVLRDPEELFEEEMVVTPGAYLMMTLLDGSRDATAVQAALVEQSGQLVPQDSIRAFIDELDRALLLENGRVDERREAIRRNYASLPARPAAHAGSSYPDDPARLRRAMDELFQGALPRSKAQAPAPNSPRGLIVPHIDIRCGGACMARGFHALRRSGHPLPRRYIILGVAHNWTPGLYTLTGKDFETPLGLVRTDPDMTARLIDLYGPQLLDGEIAHKREHSVEFASLFLKYLHDGRDDFSIVPLLCGSLHEELGAAPGRRPIERQDVGTFCHSLSTLLSEFGPSVCIIASVDLSHVGPKFGDAEDVDPFGAERIRLADQAMLEKVGERDAEGFFDHFRPDRNGRNVDAVTAVYTLLQALGPGPAETIDYGQFLESPTRSLVSYASMALY